MGERKKPFRGYRGVYMSLHSFFLSLGLLIATRGMRKWDSD